MHGKWRWKVDDVAVPVRVHLAPVERIPAQAFPASPIARERQVANPAGPFFWTTSLALAVAAVAVTLWLAAHAGSALPAEEALAQGGGPLGALLDAIGTGPARALAAVFSGFAVAGTAWAGRSLFHSDAVGLVAGALVALDPSVLAVGHLAVPGMVATGSSLAALAMLLTPRPVLHWLASPLLTVAALALPAVLVWLVPLAVLALLRGHIYAAPRHLATVTAQVIAIPAATAMVAFWLAGTQGPPWDCNGFWLGLSLGGTADLGGVAAPRNPITWFGGLGSLLILGGAATALVLARFRIARLPGRLQLRLEGPLSPGYARILWLLALCAAAPLALWLPLLALALVAGVQQLAEDAPGFGLAVSAGLLLFAALGLARAWPAVTGEDAQAALRLIPWTRLGGCHV